MNYIIGDGILSASKVFEDIANSMSFDVDVYFGAVFAKPLGIDLKDVVIYNMEPLYDNCLSFSIGYWDTLKNCIVLDYSRSNVDYLRSRGIPSFYLPYGYHNLLTRIKQREKDTDILFFGAETPRRDKLLSEFKKHLPEKFSFKWVKADNGHYIHGEQLDYIVAGARVH